MKVDTLKRDDMKILALALILFAGASFAAEGAECKNINDDSERLACYDARENPVSTDRADNENANMEYKQWEIETEINPMDDSKSIYITNKSLTTVQGSLRTTTPTMIIRCMDNKTDLFVSYQQSIAFDIDGVSGKVRLDNEQPKTFNFSRSRDFRAVFFPKPVPFLKDAIGHEKMLVQVDLLSAVGQVAEFDIRGLEEALKPLREACHW